MKQIILFKCERCHKTYDTENSATDCERSHVDHTQCSHPEEKIKHYSPDTYSGVSEFCEVCRTWLPLKERPPSDVRFEGDNPWGWGCKNSTNEEPVRVVGNHFFEEKEK